MTTGPDPLAGDPFWSRVREQHPDIDIVVTDGRTALDPPEIPTEPVVATADARRTAEGVDEAYESVRAQLPSQLADPVRVWRSGPDGHAYVVEDAWRQTVDLEVLRDLARTLSGRGWKVAGGGTDTVPRLMATNGWIDLDVRRGPAATLLVVAGPVMSLTREQLTYLADSA